MTSYRGGASWPRNILVTLVTLIVLLVTLNSRYDDVSMIEESCDRQRHQDRADIVVFDVWKRARRFDWRHRPQQQQQGRRHRAVLGEGVDVYVLYGEVGGRKATRSRSASMSMPEVVSPRDRKYLAHIRAHVARPSATGRPPVLAILPPVGQLADTDRL